MHDVMSKNTIHQKNSWVSFRLRAGGVMPCGRFGANAAWLRLAVLTCNVLTALKRLALPREADHRATQAFAVSDLLHAGQVGPSCAANPAAAGAELAALFQLALCPALAALAGVRLTQAKSSQPKQTEQPGARAGRSLFEKYFARGLAQACGSAWRCTELYRVSPAHT
jgi:hypothetical protein